MEKFIIRRKLQEAQPYSAVFDVTLIENLQSMWGGYTLQSVNTWTEKSTNQDKAEGQKNPLAFRVSASSTLQEEGYDHSTAALLDRNPVTCWIEGVDGVGIGEYLLFDSEAKTECERNCCSSRVLKFRGYLYKEWNSIGTGNQSRRSNLDKKIGIVCSEFFCTNGFYDLY